MTIVASNSLTISNVNDGTNGKTQYTHIAYANIKFLCKENSNFTLSGVSLVRYGSDSRWVYKEFQAGTYTATTTLWGSDPASGTQKNVELVSNFSNSNSINTTHIGVYVDFVESNSVDPSKYNWTLVKGADGTQGTPGKPGADGKTPYFHTAWSYSADGTDRFTTVYPNLNLLDGTKTFAGAINAWGSVGGSIFAWSETQKTQDGDFNYLTFKATKDVDWIRLYLSPDPARPNITKVSVMPNTNYTFSVWLKGTGKHTIYAYGSWTAPNTPWYLDVNITSDWRLYTFTVMSKDVIPNNGVHFFIRSYNGTEINLKKPKVEPGSVATPYMQSASEVTTANWPSYIGQYTNFMQVDSPNPSDYTWSLIRGNDGEQGPKGDPGKVVSDTEPTTRFKGLTWKYSGTADLTASDGTVIHPNTEYYYNGTHWMINYLSANNLEANSITADLIDAKNLKITDGAFVSTTTNGLVTTSTEIKDNHIAISKTDGTVKTRNDIALDSEQGLAQKFTNIDTGFYRTAGINFQGPFTSDSDGNYAQLTPQGTKLSTDVPWTKLSLMNNFNGNIEYAIINGTVYISASGVGVPAMSAGQWKQAAQLPTGSSAIPIRANRIAAGDSGDGLSWALLSNQAGGIFIRCSANKAATTNLFNATLPYPIG